MGTLQFSSPATLAPCFKHNTKPHISLLPPSQLSLPRGRVGTTTETASRSGGPEAATPEEPPSIDFGFVSSRLLPDGSPDIQIRSASGGQKLRDIMLDTHIDLYGPYAGPLLNCAGGGTCKTCMVEVVEGKELLSPRTDKEKEHLKRKPKTWRLACQTTVGNEESRGQVIIQQLPEWKEYGWRSKQIGLNCCTTIGSVSDVMSLCGKYMNIFMINEVRLFRRDFVAVNRGLDEYWTIIIANGT